VQDSLNITCIGYKPYSVSIYDAVGRRNIIKLEAATEDLQEVLIKPLNLKQLLDTIISKNKQVLISPLALNGYYRELVFVNDKCTEYADALCQYFYDENKDGNGQLKIDASRCRLEKVDKNQDYHNAQIYPDSKVNPNTLFNYVTQLSEMIKKFFPDKNLQDYKYRMDQSGNDLKITVYPKANADEYYQLTFILKEDYILRSYKLEIPAKLIETIKTRSLLGIHVKLMKFILSANYASVSNGNYPTYFTENKTVHAWGKLIAVSTDEIINSKSEFVVSDLDNANKIAPFSKSDVYKKGNICGNGIAINDNLLKNHTMIIPSAKDSVSITSLTQ